MDRPITPDERDLVRHVIRWGSDGYPVKKSGKKWWYEYRDVIKSGELFKTRREAVAAFEAYIDILEGLLREEAIAKSRQ